MPDGTALVHGSSIGMVLTSAARKGVQLTLALGLPLIH